MTHANPNRPKCLIFDFGNVVAFFDHRKACRKLSKLSVHHLSEDAIYEEIFQRGGLEELYDRGEITTDEFLKQLKLRFNISADENDLSDAWSDIFWPNESVINLIHRLHGMGYRLILASNTNELHYKWFSEQFAGALKCFRGLVLSFDIGTRKPDNEFYTKCLEVAGCQPVHCIYVDDREDFVKGANQIGMKGIAYKSIKSFLYELLELGVLDT